MIPCSADLIWNLRLRPIGSIWFGGSIFSISILYRFFNLATDITILKMAIFDKVDYIDIEPAQFRAIF